MGQHERACRIHFHSTGFVGAPWSDEGSVEAMASEDQPGAWFRFRIPQGKGRLSQHFSVPAAAIHYVEWVYE